MSPATLTLTSPWLNTAAAAARAHRSPSTVRDAAARGELHGHQPLRNGRPIRKGTWSFHAAAVDAWVRGGDDRAQRIACGCPTVRSARSA